MSPHFYAISTLVSSLSLFVIYNRYEIAEEYFFLPIFVLAAIYAVGNLFNQHAGASAFKLQRRIKPLLLLKQALARYVVWLAVFSFALLFFNNHPFYSSVSFTHSLNFIDFYYKLYIAAGYPYFIITLLVKSSRVEDYYDPAVRIISMLKYLAGMVLTNNRRRRQRNAFSVRYNRKVLLNLLMRAYFIPTMVVQVFFNLDAASRYAGNNFNHNDMLTMLLWLTTMLWFADIVNGSLSYCIESRWLENRSRSVDMTVGGWLICLCCYTPLNSVTSTLFPFALSIVDNNPQSLLLPGDNSYYTIRIIENLILLLAVYTNASLGPSIANISLKKLQTRGFYGVIRHPGVLFKMLMWWSQVVLYRKFWTVKYFVGHLAWNLIYVMRALSEERHLRKFKEYREYMAKVRYRFIPWLY